MSRNQFKTKWFILQSSICKAGFVKLLAVFLLSTVIISGNAFAQYQPPSEGTPAAQRGERTEEYKESALRRFEVVTLISLPFTAIHSFLAVRGVKMIQNGNIAPELSSTDFKIVGVTAVSYALFIGFWDWLHTHGKNPSEQLIPTSPRSPTPATRKVPTTSWQIEDSPDFVLPLVQIRF
jgi:hypothetical protein